MMIARNAIADTLSHDLPESYSKEVFNVKTDMLMNSFIGMAVQNCGWANGAT